MDFLSGFSKRFSSAARSVSEKNRESAEQARISDELREATAELERLFADYGRACYVLRLGEGAPPRTTWWCASAPPTPGWTRCRPGGTTGARR